MSNKCAIPCCVVCKKSIHLPPQFFDIAPGLIIRFRLLLSFQARNNDLNTCNITVDNVKMAFLSIYPIDDPESVTILDGNTFTYEILNVTPNQFSANIYYTNNVPQIPYLIDNNKEYILNMEYWIGN